MTIFDLDLPSAIEQLEARKTALTVRKDKLQAELELVDFQLSCLDETLQWAKKNYEEQITLSNEIIAEVIAEEKENTK